MYADPRRGTSAGNVLLSPDPPTGTTVRTQGLCTCRGLALATGTRMHAFDPGGLAGWDRIPAYQVRLDRLAHTPAHPATPLQLDYTGITLPAGGQAWAGVVVKPTAQAARRLGFVLAADAGFCTGAGQFACALSAEYCSAGSSAGGAACCSLKCSRLAGVLSATVTVNGVPTSYNIKVCWCHTLQGVGVQPWLPCR